MTEAQAHYESLRAHLDTLLKRMLWALGVLLALGFGIYFKTMQEAKSDAVASAKRQADEGVAEAFKEPRIRDAVDAAAKKAMTDGFERQIDAQLERARKQMIGVGQIADMGVRLRMGIDLSGYEELTHQIKYQTDPILRDFAILTRDSAAAQMEKIIAAERLGMSDEAKRESAKNLAGFKPEDSPSNRQILAGLIKSFRAESMSTAKAWKFFYIRELSGKAFGIYDFDQVDVIEKGLLTEPR